MCRSLTPILAISVLAGCAGYEWPPPRDPAEPADCAPIESWEIDCDCLGVVRGNPAEALPLMDSVESCEVDHDGDGRLVAGALQGACDRIAFEATTLAPNLDWTCVSVDHRRVGIGDCPSASCTGSSTMGLMAWSNSHATYIGQLDPVRSYVNLTVEGETVSPGVSGDAFVTGGDCPGADCSMRVDRLSVELDDFVLHGLPATDTTLITMDPWAGEKFADNTYVFDASAPLKLAVTIDGARGYVMGAPTETVRGAFHDVPVPLPGGGTRDYAYMTVEGTFSYGGGEGATGLAEVYLVFPFGEGAPRPTVESTFRPCTVVGADDCGWTYDASGSRDYFGNPVAYDWFDANGGHLGRDPVVILDSILEIPGQPSRFPLSLLVTDSEGRIATLVVGDAASADPDDPEDPEGVESPICSVVGAAVPAGWAVLMGMALVRRRRRDQR